MSAEVAQEIARGIAEAHAWLARLERVATLRCERCGWATYVSWLDGKPEPLTQAEEWLRVHYETRHG